MIGDTLAWRTVLAHRWPWSQLDSSCLSKTTDSSRWCQKWTCPLKSLLADWDGKMKKVHSGDSADLPGGTAG